MHPDDLEPVCVSFTGLAVHTPPLDVEYLAMSVLTDVIWSPILESLASGSMINVHQFDVTGRGITLYRTG